MPLTAAHVLSARDLTIPFPANVGANRRQMLCGYRELGAGRCIPGRRSRCRLSRDFDPIVGAGAGRPPGIVAFKGVPGSDLFSSVRCRPALSGGFRISPPVMRLGFARQLLPGAALPDEIRAPEHAFRKPPHSFDTPGQAPPPAVVSCNGGLALPAHS